MALHLGLVAVVPKDVPVGMGRCGGALGMRRAELLGIGSTDAFGRLGRACACVCVCMCVGVWACGLVWACGVDGQVDVATRCEEKRYALEDAGVRGGRGG